MSDCEGHGHKAVVYKSHFLPLRHSVVTEIPADTLANKPRLTKDQALCSLCPHDRRIPRQIVQLLTRYITRWIDRQTCSYQDKNQYCSGWPYTCFGFGFFEMQ